MNKLIDDENRVKYSSKINESELAIDTYLKKALKDNSTFRRLDSHILHRIDLKDLAKADLDIVK